MLQRLNQVTHCEEMLIGKVWRKYAPSHLRFRGQLHRGVFAKSPSRVTNSSDNRLYRRVDRDVSVRS